MPDHALSLGSGAGTQAGAPSGGGRGRIGRRLLYTGLARRVCCSAAVLSRETIAGGETREIIAGGPAEAGRATTQASRAKEFILSTQAESKPPAAAQPWIYGPWLDIIVGCGAWSAPLLMVATVAGASNSPAWGNAFYFLALIFNYPHFMATVYRAYHTREDFTRYRIYTLHFTALLALTAVLAHTSFRLVPWIFTLYICWSPWHYAGQNFGLLMMFLRRRGARVEPGDRRLLRWAFIASYAMLMVSFHAGPSNDALILSLGLPYKLALPAELILGGAFIALSAVAFAHLNRSSGSSHLNESGGPLLPALVLLFSQFLWFVLPTLFQLLSGMHIPQTRYSSGILAVLHSTQYLWITSYYQRREAKASGEPGWRISAYFGTLVAGGVALFICGPWLVSYAFRFDFTVSFLIFTALVNIHHFILDGAVWKLRDKRVAALLIEPGARPASESGKGQAGESGQGVIAATRWLAGQSPTARALRIGLAAALILWGVLDQVHYVLETDAANLTSLLRAARLDPYDSSLQLRIARADLQTGDVDQALGAMRRAVAANPQNPIPQQALGRALIEQRRWSEAYEHYQKMLTLFPRDADALVTFGILAQQQGDLPRAMEVWEEAIQIDPRQANAHLYLAEGLDQRNPGAAFPHYEAYLRLTAAQLSQREKQGEDLRASTDQFATVTLKMADDYARVNMPSLAVQAYGSVLRLAAQASDKSLQAVALAHLADLQDKTGDIAAAAATYQHALALDRDLADVNVEASDWFNYGQFLIRRGQSAEIALACFLQAEKLLDSSPGPYLDTARKVRQQTEKTLGPRAPAVRKDLTQFLARAMSLTPH